MAGVAATGLALRQQPGDNEGTRLPLAQVPSALRAFWTDGFFAAAQDAFILAYLPLLASALGASATQIGLLAASQSLGSMLALYPGAFAARRVQSRRWLVVIYAGVVGRILLLLAALTVAVTSGQTALYLVIVIFTVRAFLGSFVLPAWTSLAADIIPTHLRARYFASRNFAISAATLALTPLGGILLDLWGFPGGFVAALSVSFGFGIISTIAYARIPEPPRRPTVERALRTPHISPLKIIQDHKFRSFLLATFIVQFSATMAGPFFNVYLKDGLRASNFDIGMLTTVSAVSGLAGQLLFGDQLARRGPLAITRFSLVILPTLPWLWLFVTAPWMVFGINLIGGAAWAAFNLANFQHLLEITEEDERESYVAFFHTTIFLAMFIAPFTGGLIIDHLGYHAVFFASGAGRCLATAMFFLVVAAPSLRDKGARANPVVVTETEAAEAAGEPAPA